MTTRKREPMDATITTCLLPLGTHAFKGKKVMVLPEDYYKEHHVCPHCISAAPPEVLSDLREATEIIADAFKCKVCDGVFIVLVHPKIYLPKPIQMNWLLKEKGDTTDGQTEEEVQASKGSDSGSKTIVG